MAKQDPRLINAITSGDHLTATHLLEAEADAFDLNEVFTTRDTSYTCLTKVAETGNIELVAKLVAHGAKVNLRNNFGATALTYAAKYGHVSIIEFLLKQDADAELATESGYTPLAIAYKTQQDIKVFRALLEGGAKAGIVDPEKGTTLVEAAIEGSDNELLALAIAAKPDLDAASNSSGCTPLRLAARNGNTDAVRALIDAGAKLDKKNKDGFTALMYAAELGRDDIVQMLIDAGADISVKNKLGQTAYDIAENAGKTDTCDLIRKGPAPKDAIAGFNKNMTELKDSLGNIQASLERIQQTLLNDQLSQIVSFGNIEKARAFFDTGFWNETNRPTVLWEHLKIALLNEDRPMMKLLTAWDAPCTAENLAELQKELPEKYPTYLKLLRASGVKVPVGPATKATKSAAEKPLPETTSKLSLTDTFNKAAGESTQPTQDKKPKPPKNRIYPF